MTNLEALQQAMNELKGSGLKMWLYINKNQDNYRFDLSRQACLEWGIKKDSYYDGLKDLIATGYLRQSQPGSNLYIFYENALAENPTSAYSEFYFTENTTPPPGKQKLRKGFQNGHMENPERNNTYNTKILQDNTASAFSERETKEEAWRRLGF